MKKYSNLYPLIFGVIFFIVGIFSGQIFISVFFGVVPSVIAILLMIGDCKGGKNVKSCCARCGIELSLVPFMRLKKIGDKKFCDACVNAIVKSFDDTCADQSSVQKKISYPEKATLYKVCHECKKIVAITDVVIMDGYPVCKKCADANKTTVSSIYQAHLKKQKDIQIQKLVGQLDQLYDKRKKEEAAGLVKANLKSGFMCVRCKKTIEAADVIYIDGIAYCSACCGFLYDCDYTENEIIDRHDDIKQISYKIDGISGQSLFLRVVNIAERLITGGFSFSKAVIGGVDEIGNIGVSTHDASYTDYKSFKTNMESDFIKRKQEEYENSDGAISSLEYSYIHAYLYRNTLKVYIAAENNYVILRWFDDTDKYFNTTRIFAMSIIDELYNNCSLVQINNIRTDEEFLSNW